MEYIRKKAVLYIGFEKGLFLNFNKIFQEVLSMKKKLILLFLLFCIVFIIPGLAEDEEEYYMSFYVDNYSSYPGDNIYANLSVNYYYIDEDGNFSEDVDVEIYKLPKDLTSDYEEYVKEHKPDKEISKEITMETWDNTYWYGYLDFELSSLKSGNYYAVARTDKVTYSTSFRISKVGMSLRPSKEGFILFVQDKKSGKALENIDVTLYMGDKTKKFKTDADGIVRIHVQDYKELEVGNSYRVLAVMGEDSAEISFTIPGEQEYFKGYIYTDRPIYRPEQEVNFKAILRMEKGALLEYSADEKIEVLINDPDGSEVYKETLKTDEFGSLSGSFILDEEPPLGYYYIYCTCSDGQQATGSFQVEEYRKPEFEITLAPDKENYIQGDNMIFNLDVNYYFGAPVPDTEFTYEIYRNYYYPYFWNYWWEEDLGRYYNPYYGYGGDFIKSDSGKTDKNGHATFSCEAEKVDYDANYVVTVRMVDESRREVTGSASTLITRGAFYLKVKPEKYYYKPGDKVHFKVEADDYSNNPVETDVKVLVRYEKYNEKKETWEWEEEKITNLKTDENGLCYYDYTPNEDGYYDIVCTAEDQNKNEITSTGYFYCYSGRDYNWYRFSNIEIIPDKDVYEKGETAGLFIVCPFEGVKGLVTVEGDDILEEKVLDFSNRTASMEIEITENYTPNFFVTVSFFYEKTYYFQTKKIICPSKDKFLTVSITPDKEKYKPRDTAKFIVKTLDNNEKPVTSQITLGVADESVYAVAGDTTPNIQKFFYGMRQNNIYTYCSNGSNYGGPYYYDDYLYLGRTKCCEKKEMLMMDAEKPASSTIASGMVSGEDQGLVQPEFTREYFPDTAYFNPNIITDQNGVAEVIFEMPDSLTTWRATAKAVSKDTGVGQNTKEVIVTKDLLARLIAPRFFTERDEAVITGIVHNYLNSEKTVYASLEIDGGIELIDSKDFKVNVPPNGSAPINWKVKVKRAGDCTIKLTALTDEESDAVQLTIPVLPHGTEKFSAVAGSTKDTAEEELILPSEAEKGSAKLLILLEPSIASTVLSSLDYLIGFPYGCVEQTMSRFLPSVIVTKTLGELDVYDEKMNKDLPKMVKEGFERLYNFHHSDGGWGWWENDDSHPYMTAYVVYGLSLAKEAGYSVDESKLQSGIDWMRSHYEEEEDLNTKTYMAFSVTTAGSDCKDWLKELYKKKDDLNSYAAAILALSLHKSGLTDEAMEMVKLLEKTAEESGTTANWSGKTGHYGWTDNKIETTAYCLKAILTIKPESELIPKVVRYLSFSRNGNYWYSTKDTAAAVMALTEYIKISKELNPDFTADVYFNGTKIKSVKFTKEDVGQAGEKIEIPFDQGLLVGKNTIKIKMTGKGMLYYAAYLKYYTDEENITAADSGFKIERTYYILNPEEDDPEKAKEKLGSKGEIKVSSQDIILVEVEVSGGNNYEYLIIEDPKPAGCEYDTEQRGNYSEWNYWYSHSEKRDEKIAYFSTYWWSGANKVTYRLRAETPGTFHVMPARAYLMYTEEIGGNSDEIILTVNEADKEEIASKPVPVSPDEMNTIEKDQEVSANIEKEVKEDEKKGSSYWVGIVAAIGALFCILIVRGKKGC